MAHGTLSVYAGRPDCAATATDWRLDVHAGPDFLDRMRDEAPGGIAVFSGRNRGKIERIIAALQAGLHVLADKPAIIEPTDLPRLDAALVLAREAQGAVLTGTIGTEALDRRCGVLIGPRPQVDVAQAEVVTVESEWARFCPGADDEVVRLMEALARKDRGW
jgi:hypothetical protein